MPTLKFVRIKYTSFRHRFVPTGPGIYRIEVDGVIRYVGQATNLQRRYTDHWDEQSNPELRDLILNATQLEFDYHMAYDRKELNRLEREYIDQHIQTVAGINKRGT